MNNTKSLDFLRAQVLQLKLKISFKKERFFKFFNYYTIAFGLGAFLFSLYQLWPSHSYTLKGESEIAKQNWKHAMYQISEAVTLLRSSQNQIHLAKNSLTQLTNLCKIIGQSQILLLQINVQIEPHSPESNRILNKNSFLDQNLQDTIQELHRACEFSEDLEPSQALKKAWFHAGRAQKRLSQLSRSMGREDAT